MAKKKSTARKPARKAVKKPVKKATKKAVRKKTAKTAARKTTKKAAGKKSSRSKSSTKRVAAAAQAEKIAKRGENVRLQTREMVIGLVRDHKLDLQELSTIAGEVMRGAVSGVKELDPKNRDSTLRKVVDGVGDAFSQTANATGLALREGASHGQAFAQREVKKTTRDLRELQDRFIEVLTRTAKHAGKEVRVQTDTLNKHIRETAKSVRPPVEKALRAAGEHPMKFAGETASATAKAVPQAAGVLLHALGGLLQDAGKAVSRAGRSEPKRKTSRTRT